MTAPIANLVCTTPTCERLGQFTQIHADTLLPVHCGGCHRVLHCDHQPETRIETQGTIGAPERHEITHCTVCRSELNRTRTALPPIDLSSLPASILDMPAGP